MEAAPHEAAGLLIQLDPHDDDCEYDVIRLGTQAGLGEFVLNAADVAAVVDEETFYQRTWVWHTHPGGTAGPSRGDIKAAAMGVRNLVMSVPEGVVYVYQRVRWYGRSSRDGPPEAITFADG